MIGGGGDSLRALVVRLERLLVERQGVLEELEHGAAGGVAALRARLERLDREQASLLAELEALLPPDGPPERDPGAPSSSLPRVGAPAA